MSTAFPLDLQPHLRLPSDLGYGPGMPPDKFILGDVWITRHSYGPSVQYITVDDKASSHVLIGDELLRDLMFDVRKYQVCMWVRLEDPRYDRHIKSECPSCEPIEIASKSDPVCFTGMLFHVDARNRHLVYEIGKYRPGSRTWEASWPD